MTGAAARGLSKRPILSSAGCILTAFLYLSPQANGAEPESLSASVPLPPAPQAKLAWGRDPFTPVISGIDEANLRLMAIFFNDIRPSAIINGKIVYVGGAVNGHKIIDIGKGHVILHGEAGTIRLEVAGIVRPEGANDAKKKP
ncbi:MAG: hypothetical protein HZB83_01860 [Deltaproteobacteria bacterium]|nr:hypothetical protein [Deltaproteobacteria bacterium]